MQKTDIDWCDYSWNPVTGCFKDCGYCYAKKTAVRFGNKDFNTNDNDSIYEISENSGPFPRGFQPTFYWNRLDKPQQRKKPQNIFVCSMADLFGEWVPDEWIVEVFNACKKAPQHRYLFLTKNSDRYIYLASKRLLPLDDNFWYGLTITDGSRDFSNQPMKNLFVSYEPILGEALMGHMPLHIKWVILGALTGNNKLFSTPYNIKEILDYWANHYIIKQNGIKIFMKESLEVYWDKPLIQEYPWDNEKEKNDK